MNRIITKRLISWKNNSPRQPLVLKGARQVGKTYSLKRFGKSEFPNCHYINFEENERFASIFKNDLQDLSFILETKIDLEQDLILFDEIQDCPRALTSLKYFSEEIPQLAICCAGSLLGVHLARTSYPVGKIFEAHMYPLSFQEFLEASTEAGLHAAYNQISFSNPPSETLHQVLWEKFKIYLITGGLPAIVQSYIDHKNDLYDAMQQVREKQNMLISAYVADMAKHSGKQNAMHIERLWKNIPSQLGNNHYASANKFTFKGVIPGVKGYDRLANIIDWLQAAGLILRVPIVNCAQAPLSAYEKENFFKLFIFDSGILGALCKLAPKTILDYEFGSYKGFVAENVIAQELNISSRGLNCWREGHSEIEFLQQIDGENIPIEVKSGWITKAKSLSVFCQKYTPSHACIFSAKNLKIDSNNKKHYYPLYLASRFPIADC